MRGAHYSRVRGHVAVGIIPAYAGSTARLGPGSRPAGDHPRVCGEHLLQERHERGDWGSSPRMRGARRIPCLCRRTQGIIPAYAGSTPHTVSVQENARDHPRVCGEHYKRVKTPATAAGSSPRMRGAPCAGRARAPARRIIPAYAGSTAGSSKVRAGSRDHPRVCGEHAWRGRRTRPARGSSPRMRGARGHAAACSHNRGIIPAYAGSTAPRRRRPWRTRDHPRVCGEHYCVRMGICFLQGSSPRMRGAR